MISLAVALATQTIAIPPTFAIYCLASSGVAQPVRNTDYERLTAAFRSEFSFNATVSMTSETTGLLVFRGGRSR